MRNFCKKAMYYIEVFYPQGKSEKEELHMIGPASASVGKGKRCLPPGAPSEAQGYRFLTAVREKLEKYIEINSGFRKKYTFNLMMNFINELKGEEKWHLEQFVYRVILY